MASSPSILCCVSASLAMVAIMFFNATPTIMAAEEFKVGDALGWRLPSSNQTDMYNLWASKTKFHVGDSLRFEYTNDSVVVVDKWGFYHCNASSPVVTAYTDGNDTLITLEEAGPMYFISGNHSHCKEGQRLLIEVLPLHPPKSHAPSPSSTALPPKSSGFNPGTGFISPASSKSGSAVSSVEGVVSVSVVFTLVAFVATTVA